MAKRFGVSEMTIRRDFHGMEEQGLVTIDFKTNLSVYINCTIIESIKTNY